MAPKTIFIIPYRDREYHKEHFNVYIKHILSELDPISYEIFFIHQADNRPFHRGAMKNIGFLAMKERWPNDYKNITFILISNCGEKEGILRIKGGNILCFKELETEINFCCCENK